LFLAQNFALLNKNFQTERRFLYNFLTAQNLGGGEAIGSFPSATTTLNVIHILSSPTSVEHKNGAHMPRHTVCIVQNWTIGN